MNFLFSSSSCIINLRLRSWLHFSTISFMLGRLKSMFQSQPMFNVHSLSAITQYSPLLWRPPIDSPDALTMLPYTLRGPLPHYYSRPVNPRPLYLNVPRSRADSSWQRNKPIVYSQLRRLYSSGEIAAFNEQTHYFLFLRFCVEGVRMCMFWGMLSLNV